MRRPAALLAALALLAGCGDDDGDKGKVVKGDGYEVTVPEGWDDQSSKREQLEVGGFTPDLVLTGEREDGFTTNVNVVLTEGVERSLDAQTRAERELLERGGPVGDDVELQPAENLTETEDITLGDRPARAYEFELDLPQGDRSAQLRQLIAIHEGTGYAITLTANPDRFDEDRDDFEAILESWRWR